MMTKRFVFSAVVGLAFAVVGRSACAELINFDDQGLVGPSFFFQAGNAQQLNIGTGIGNVMFDGGVILTNTANLPANQTSIYGTASVNQTYTNPLMITFPVPITNFFLEVLNGNTINVDYEVRDNMGNSAMFNLVPNLNSGATTIGFAATGTMVFIEAKTLGVSLLWDFFIDNIRFNEALPPELMPEVPEPASLALWSLGAVALVGLGWRRRKRVA